MNLGLEHISHAYGNTQVLSDISFEIAPHQIVCVIGPSGCGKSTLLRLIGGLERPDSGNIIQRGELSTNSLNPFTYIFQDFSLLPWRNVEQNVSLVLEDHPLTVQAKRIIIDDVLSRTKLLDFRLALPKQLSNGMKQRVAIARALAVKPQIMLMDEPLSALDGQTRELLINDFINLWQTAPFGAVYVTHNLTEAVRLGDVIIVLSRCPGRIYEVINIDIPIQERQQQDAFLADTERKLWQLMCDEALITDQTLVDEES